MIRFEFSGQSFTTRFQRLVYWYRLQGYDPDWRQTSQASVSYNKLPEGAYTFAVKAVDQDFNYSQAATVSLEVFHQPFTSPVRFDSVLVDDIFASFYPTYTEQGLGRVVVVNEHAQAVLATLRFDLPGILRQPFAEELTLAPGSSQRISINGLLDPAVLSLKETRTLRAEIELEYGEGQETTAIKQKVDIEVYGGGALRWDKVARAAAFITPADAQVTAFARQSLVGFKDQIEAYGQPLANLVRAMVLFEALKGHGLRYLTDANSPYAQGRGRSFGDRSYPVPCRIAPGQNRRLRHIRLEQGYGGLYKD